MNNSASKPMQIYDADTGKILPEEQSRRITKSFPAHARIREVSPELNRLETRIYGLRDSNRTFFRKKPKPDTPEIQKLVDRYKALEAERDQLIAGCDVEQNTSAIIPKDIYDAPTPEFHARMKTEIEKERGSNPVCLGGLSHNYRYSDAHYSIVGPTGYGKTSLITMMIDSILSPEKGKHAPRHRAFIYDNKREMIPKLDSLGFELEDSVFLINPDDQRGRAWDVAKDFKGRSGAARLANLLVPEPNNAQTNPHFINIQRGLITSLVQHLQKSYAETNERWTLRDLLVILEDFEICHRLMCFDRSNERDFETTFGTPEKRTEQQMTNWGSVRSGTKKWDIIAIRWWEQGRQNGYFSIDDWYQSDRKQILVFSNGAENDDIRKPFREMFLSSLISKGLAGGHAGECDTWLFLDEFVAIADSHKMPQMMREGRSHGLRVVIGIQDEASLNTKFGPDDAASLLEQFGNRIYFGIKRGAKELSDSIGTYEADIVSISQSRGENWGLNDVGHSQQLTVQVSHGDRPFLPAHEISDLPKTGANRPITAFYRLVNGRRIVKASVPFETWTSPRFSGSPDVAGEEPVLSLDDQPYVWEKHDYLRVGFNFC